ncbi:gibberellin-regulated protein 6-like [Magnolia sinica]|uniref:gibberellin-regulated protein 6-like n=1 Tax=Magnolia sinica TaxID=86752 RepID=UPI002657D40C|nr:gibberellin-regulated protein 6-like [Magnolia sinica]
MERSVQALMLLLLLFFAGIIASTEGLVEEEHGRNLVSVVRKNKHGHRHSGFSQAECPGACSFRCSKTQHHKPCMFFCQKCCFKCRCVPPGTYGHKEVCPCYNNWKTQTGGPKCP